MKLLAIDTSAKVAAAAICTEEQILAETTINTKLTHSQTLMPVCRGLLDNAKIAVTDLDGFAVSAGPGSFTGLRIGMAAVKGMAFALDKPCYPVSTLEALAYNLMGFTGVACPVMDARCGQVYQAFFEITYNGVNRLCADRAISVAALADELADRKETIWLCGDGAELCDAALRENPADIRLAPLGNRLQRAAGVARAAFASAKPVTAQELTPEYLRLPQAERERAERLARQQQNTDMK